MNLKPKNNVKSHAELEEKFRSFFNQSFDGIALYDRKGKVIEWNRGMERITGIRKDDIKNCYLWDMNFQLLPKERQTSDYKKKLKKALLQLIDQIPSIESRIDEAGVLCPDNQWREIQINTFPVKMKQDCFVGIICRDITTLRQQEKELKEIRDNLEMQVQERTKELINANKELLERSDNLKELNVALKVLLEKRENDKRMLEERVLANVKMLIEPCLEKIKIQASNTRLKTNIEILETNLNDIISSFSLTLSSTKYNLTPTELEIANYIKEGKRTKEIASLMNLSIGTIKVHREHIRKKIGLQYSKKNLVSFLKVLQ
jgi:PAS domain S-box-containing protein